MNTDISSSTESPKVFFSNGRLVTTSQAVADYFDKQHKHVLAKIDTLDCSPEFTSANFSAHVENQMIGIAEREIRYFEITKDGFMFLVMGFTGKKAARLKEAYIAKFNHMEAELSKPVTAPADHQSLDYQFLTTVSGGQVTHVRMAKPGEIFASFDYFQEMAKRAGYLIIHSDDIKNMTLESIMKAGESARILSRKFLKN